MNEKFHIYMRIYEKWQQETEDVQLLEDWTMCADELVEKGMMQQFEEFYVKEKNKEVAEWNRLKAKREDIKND